MRQIKENYGKSTNDKNLKNVVKVDESRLSKYFNYND